MADSNERNTYSFPPALYPRNLYSTPPVTAQGTGKQFARGQFSAQTEQTTTVPASIPRIPRRSQADLSVSEKEEQTKATTSARSRNWSDVEIRYLLKVCKDNFPISKRYNSSAWEGIAEELNQLLNDDGLASIRTGLQCKTKMKNLEFNRVKDYNNKNGNDRVSFVYFDDIDEVLGCRPKISPKNVVKCGLEESSPDNSKTLSSATPKVTSDEDELREKEGDVVNLSLSEPLFFNKRKDVMNASKRKNPDGAATKKTPCSKRQKKKVKEQTKGNTDYLEFLNERQKRDHEFFERLAEEEAERDLKSQQMMFSMVKEVAKIFKGDN